MNKCNICENVGNNVVLFGALVAITLAKDLTLTELVDKILDVIENDKFKLYSVARSSDSKSDGIVELTKEQYNRLKNTPETDDDL